MRPAIYHCFGRDKSGAKGALNALALEGWETLPAVLLGVGNLMPLWQQTGWASFGGVCWHGPSSAVTLTKNLHQLLFDLWDSCPGQRTACWVVHPVGIGVHLPRRRGPRSSPIGRPF